MAEILKDVKKGIDYFRDLYKGKKPQMQRFEESIEGAPPQPVPPPPTQDDMKKRGRRGSKAWTDAQLRKGYRRP